MVNRLRNYGLWVAIFAFVAMICQTFGFIKLPDNYNDIVNGLLGILVMLGIINDPTTQNKGFLDDKKIGSEKKNNDTYK